MIDLFEAIGGAIAARVSGPAAIEQALGLSFQGSAEGSNPSFNVMNSRRSRIIDELIGAQIRVERRVGDIRLMQFDVDGRVRCIGHDEVVARFGSSPELSVPRAGAPPNAPVYYIYHQSWGDVRIGLSRQPPECVATIVIEFRT